MKELIKFNLTEKVFCELSRENDFFYVSAYFRFTRRCQTVAYKDYKDALTAYNFVLS